MGWGLTLGWSAITLQCSPNAVGGGSHGSRVGSPVEPRGERSRLEGVRKSAITTTDSYTYYAIRLLRNTAYFIKYLDAVCVYFISTLCLLYYLLVRLRVRPEHDRVQSCAIALRSPASERSSDLIKRYSPDKRYSLWDWVYALYLPLCIRARRAQPRATPHPVSASAHCWGGGGGLLNRTRKRCHWHKLKLEHTPKRTVGVNNSKRPS